MVSGALTGLTSLAYIHHRYIYHLRLYASLTIQPIRKSSRVVMCLSLYRIFAVCAASASIDLLIAVKGAYFVPAIYDSGISKEYGSILLIISPLLVLVFQNYLGSASDRCSCKWGRRKPFILGITVALLLGLALFPLSTDLSDLAETQEVRWWTLIVLILTSTLLIDFNVTSVQVPLRAFLLDVLPQKQVVTGNIVYTVLALLGATVGFGIGSVNWPSIFSLSNSLSVQLKFVCGLSLLITAALTVITLCSVKEQPLQYDTEVKQVSEDLTANNVKAGHDVQATEGLDTSQDHQKKYSSYEDITMLPYGSHLSNTVSHEGNSNCCTIYKSVVDNLCFIRYMSLSTATLLIAVFFSIIAFITQITFFTHYVGEVIYNGDVLAAENSTAYKKYTDGVKTGSLVLGVSSLSGFSVLLILRPAIKYFGIRPLFILPYILMMIQSGVLIVSHNLIVAIVVSPAIYIVILQYLTFPHILISMYKTKGLLLRKSWPYPNTNLMGRSCSLIMIATEMGKVTSLTANGPLMTAYGSAESVMIFTCACSFVGAIVACFVTVPSILKMKKSGTKVLSSVVKPEHQIESSTTESTTEQVVQ